MGDRLDAPGEAAPGLTGSLDVFWLRDESLEDSANLPEPHVLAAEIADDLQAALEEIEDVLGDLRERVG